MENSRFLGNLPENIVYNGLLYTYNLRENAFINQFGHRIDPSAAPAFITEAKAFEQQNLAILDISSSSSDNSSSRPRPSDDVAEVKDPKAEPRAETPTTEVVVTWSIDDTQTSKTDGYVLLRSTDPKGPFTEIKTSITPETRVFIDTGLTPNTTYYYQIAATLGGKEGPLSTVVSAKTSSVTPPAVGITAPSGLTATSITQSRIDLAWVDNSTNELGFYLYESLNGSTFSIIEVLGIGATTASVKGLTQDRNYWYRVQAFATGSTSAFSNTVALRTLPTIPTAPSNLSLLVGGTSQIQVSWTDNSNNEQFFNVFRSTDGVSYPFGITLPAGSTTYLNTGLSAGTTYFYRVNAANTGGTSGFAGPVSATTLPTIPTAPSNLRFTLRSTARLDLLWDDNSSNEQGFLVQSSLNGITYSTLDTTAANTPEYSARGLNVGTTYFFRVAAFNAGGTSAFSGATSWQTLPNAPAIPSNFTATSASSSQIDLSWTDVTGENGYQLDLSTNGTNYSGLTTLGPNVVSYSHTGLNSETTYWYRISAFNIGGTSGFALANAQTAGVTLAAPTALSAYSSVPATKNFLRYTEGFTTAVSTANGGWASAIGSATTVSIDNSITTPNGTTGAALMTVNSPTVIGGIQSTITESGVTIGDYWSGSVWMRGKTATCGGINIVIRDGSGNELVLPSTLKVLSGPGTLVTSSVGETHWNGITGLSKTEWTRIAWNNLAPWGPTGLPGAYTSARVRLTVNFYSGTNPSAVTGDSIYVWGAQYERNPYPTEYLAATGGSFAERPFQGLTSQINLYWQDNSTDETGFSVERSTTLGGVYSGITALPANTTIYSDRGLSSGSTYFYRVRAFKPGATSGFAGPTSAVTYPTIPTAPSNLRFTDRSSNELMFEWNDNSSNESGFAIESSLAGITYNPLAIVGANINNYNADGLSAGTTYFFRVAAFNAGGTSSFAGPTSWITMRDLPAAPSFTSILAGSSSQINVNWTNVADENGYDLFRGTTSASLFGITTLGPDVTSFADSGLSAGTTYFYRIRGFNEGGAGSFSGITSTTTIVAPPSAPFISSITSGITSLTLGWSDVANETGYNLYRSLNGIAYSGITTLGAGSTRYIDAGLTSNTLFYYQIEAFNAGGTSPRAFTTSASTLPNTPAAPSNLRFTNITENAISIAWNDNSTNEAGFVIQGSLAGITYTQLATTGAGVTNYTSSGLSSGTTYYFRVAAFGDGATSSFAGPTFAMTLSGGTAPSAPTGFTALSATDSAVTLQWTDTSTNEDGFLIYYRGIT
jgi:titin